MAQVTMTKLELEQLVERSARRGAKEALASIGLHDEDAGKDIRDLRQLIDGWRDVKKSVVTTTVKWFVLVILGIISVGAWTRFND
jgi:2-iminoacetate synthase ThiH